MKLFSFIPAAVLVALAFAGTQAATVSSGELIKCKDFTSVYYVGADSKRYVFPNDRSYFTWYTNFDSVRTITCAELGGITIGGNATYRPGAKMVKIQSDPRVYVVAHGGVLRHIGSEAVAVALYGSTWNKQVDDIPDAFFVNYTLGTAVTTASDYNRTLETQQASTINADKNLTQLTPGQTEVSITANGAFSPASVLVQLGDRVRWNNTSTGFHRVAVNPHPTHTDLPGFDSLENIAPGFTYTYTFNQKGTFNYHDHVNPSITGSVIVQ